MENQNQYEENSKEEIENIDDFDTVKEIYESKRKNIYEIEQNLRLLKDELKEIQTYMQSICKHEFVREVVTMDLIENLHIFVKNAIIGIKYFN